MPGNAFAYWPWGRHIHPRASDAGAGVGPYSADVPLRPGPTHRSAPTGPARAFTRGRHAGRPLRSGPAWPYPGRPMPIPNDFPDSAL